MEMHRRTYYGLIHGGVRALLVERFGHYSEQEYQQVLDGMTGKNSCFLMSDDELMLTLESLCNEGYVAGSSLK